MAKTTELIFIKYLIRLFDISLIFQVSNTLAPSELKRLIAAPCRGSQSPQGHEAGREPGCPRGRAAGSQRAASPGEPRRASGRKGETSNIICEMRQLRLIAPVPRQQPQTERKRWDVHRRHSQGAWTAAAFTHSPPFHSSATEGSLSA